MTEQQFRDALCELVTMLEGALLRGHTEDPDAQRILAGMILDDARDLAKAAGVKDDSRDGA